MRSVLLKYMENRLENEVKESTVENFNNGPVVTVSRECGCDALNISNLIVEKLNLISDKPWASVTKEILEKSASELNLDHSQIEYVFKSKEKSIMSEVLAAFSNKYYHSDKKIRNTIANVVKAFAKEGNSLIIGRGGVVLTKNMEKSLHIKLQAPLVWRAQQLQKIYNQDLDDMIKYANKIDQKRADLRNLFGEQDFSEKDFDVVFNTKTLSDELIAETCVSIIKEKQLI